jgi:hypothetical protein
MLPASDRPLWNASLTGLAFYVLTTLVVVAAVWTGTYVLRSNGYWRGFVGNFANMDGSSHVKLVMTGYPREGRPLTVARFPAYLVLGGVVRTVFGVRTEVALLIISHLSLLGAFVLMALYLRARQPEAATGLTDVTLLALGLWPSTLFFRMTYTESLLLVSALLAMYGMQRRWPLVWIALIVGFATGVRPVGVALTAVFGLYLWQESRTISRFLGRAFILLPLASWGLAAYMVYLQIYFGDPFLFGTAHNWWVKRLLAWPEKLVPLLTLEPIWSPYVPSYRNYWLTCDANYWFDEPVKNPLINFGFMNPLFFVATVALVVVGACKRWLDARETALSALLLLIPYCTMAYDNLMLSQPRFASVIFPVYIVMGHLLSRLPRWVVAIFFLGCAALLFTYSALFAAGYGQRYKILY